MSATCRPDLQFPADLHAAHRLTQSPDQSPKPSICCVLPPRPRVDPEQASSIVRPDLELCAATNFCFVCDVVRETAIKHRVGGNLCWNPYGLQFFQNDIS